MISYETFHNEIVKIAEERRKPDITKERLKRLLIATGATGAGAFLGEGVSQAIRRKAHAPLRDSVGKLIPRAVARRYGPAALGALGGAVGGIAYAHRKKTDDYIHDGPK